MAEVSEKFGNIPNSNMTMMFASPTDSHSGLEKKSSKFLSNMRAKKTMFRTPQAPKKTLSLQSTGTLKAKGLSMRTYSELNIHGSNNANVTEKKDNPMFLKTNFITDAQLKLHQPVSPARQKFLQKQTVRSDEKRDQIKARDSFQGESKKLMGSEKVTPNTFENDAFSLCEPELLANDYDEEAEFYKNCTETLDMEFKELKMCISQVDDDDEGFISGPEPLHEILPPFKIYEDPVSEDLNSAMELDLPEVSDIEEM